MKNNGGIIGPDNIPTQSLASGIWSINNIYDYRIDNIWPPLVLPSIWSGRIITNNSYSNNDIDDVVSMCNIIWRRYVLSFTYTASEVSAACDSAKEITITGLSFYVYEEPLYQPLPNYAIGMKLHTSSVTTNVSGSGFTSVFDQSSQSFTEGEWKEFTFDTEFDWDDSKNLSISFAWGQCPTNYHASGRVEINTSSGSVFFNRTDDAGTYSINDSCSYSEPYRPVVKLKYKKVS